MRLPRYAGSLFNALLLTSVTTNLIIMKRAAADEKSRLVARSSILRDLIDRMRRGENVTDAEYGKLMALAYRDASQATETADTSSKLPAAESLRTMWKEALLGRTPSEESNEALDQRIREEWEAALRELEDSPSTSPARIPSLAEPSPYSPDATSIQRPIESAKVHDPLPYDSRRYL